MDTSLLPEYDFEAYSPSPKSILCCPRLRIISAPSKNRTLCDYYFQKFVERSGTNPLADDYDLPLEYGSSRYAGIFLVVESGSTQQNGTISSTRYGILSPAQRQVLENSITWGVRDYLREPTRPPAFTNTFNNPTLPMFRFQTSIYHNGTQRHLGHRPIPALPKPRDNYTAYTGGMAQPRARWYAPHVNEHFQLIGFRVIPVAKVRAAQEKGDLETISRGTCLFGRCHNHPGAEFTAQWYNFTKDTEWEAGEGSEEDGLDHDDEEGDEFNPDDRESGRGMLPVVDEEMNDISATNTPAPPVPRQNNSRLPPTQGLGPRPSARQQSSSIQGSAAPVTPTAPTVPAGATSKYLHRDAKGNVTHKFCSKEFHNSGIPRNKLKPIADFDLNAAGTWRSQCRRCTAVDMNRKQSE